MATMIDTTEASFPCSDGFEMRAYLARPQSAENLPGIVMIAEITGVHEEMKRLARETAAAGYAVCVPDVFMRGNRFLCIARLMRELKAEKGRGIEDMLAARRWLQSLRFVDAERIAVAGFCLGGGFALVLAKTGLFKASADFYGDPPKSLAAACPVVASYGGRDKIMTPHVTALDLELQNRNIPHDMKVYPDAGHGFMNTQPNKPAGTIFRLSPLHGEYHPAAAQDAMQRMLAFFAAHV